MRASLRSVAAAAGVNVATASRALRGLDLVAPATRRKVETAAARLGYVRDPELSATLAFIRRPDKAVYRETLAFLVDRPVGAKRSGGGWLSPIYRGALAQARKLGYGLEPFVLSRERAAQERLGRMLRARGIRGVIIAPVTRWQPAQLKTDLSGFAVVQISNTIWKPVLHRVEFEFFNEMVSALLRLKRAGYRRIGLVLEQRYERIRRWSPLGALLVFQQFSQDFPLLLPYEKCAPWSRSGFRSWLEEQRPDVLVTNGDWVGECLAEFGWESPRDIGVMRLDATRDGRESGLIPDHAALAAAAVDLLANLLANGSTGAPEFPRILQLGHGWNEGSTLRSRAAADRPAGSGPQGSAKLR